jgi:hypothetical protein
MSKESESTELATELVLEELEADESASQFLHWHKLVALSTLILALLAALGGLLSGITAHESSLEKTEEIISLTVLEGDRMSVEVLKAKHDILTSLGEVPDQAEIQAIEEFEDEISEKRAEVTQEEGLAQAFGQTHLVFAISVTLLAAGISLSGMAVVVSEKWLWTIGLIIGGLGAIGIVLGIISMFV